MKERYELIYGFQHCVGRTQYHFGHADTEFAADQWAQTIARRTSEVMKVPETDPVRWCPVRHCHMKRQQPWFGYRSMDGVMTIRRTVDG